MVELPIDPEIQETSNLPVRHKDAYGDLEMWISHDAVSEVFTGAFWNDEDIERQKEWWVTEHEHQSLLEHLEALNAQESFAVAIQYLRGLGKLSGRVPGRWRRDLLVGSVCGVGSLKLKASMRSNFPGTGFQPWPGQRLLRLVGMLTRLNRVFGSFTDIPAPVGLLSDRGL